MYIYKNTCCLLVRALVRGRKMQPAAATLQVTRQYDVPLVLAYTARYHIVPGRGYFAKTFSYLYLHLHKPQVRTALHPCTKKKRTIAVYMYSESQAEVG